MYLTSMQFDRKYVVHELHSKTKTEKEIPELSRPILNEIIGKDIRAKDDRFERISEDDHFSVSAATIKHSIPCYGYVFQEPDKYGSLDMDVIGPILDRNKGALKLQGVEKPKTLLCKLKEGITLEMPDGTMIHPPDKVKGQKLTILGDTYDPSNIIPFAMNSNVLIHEATNAYLSRVLERNVNKTGRVEIDKGGFIKSTFRSTKDRSEEEKYGFKHDSLSRPGRDLIGSGDLADIGNGMKLSSAEHEKEAKEVRKRAISHGHSTPEMAGRFAAKIRAKILILNHFSSRYAGDDFINTESALIMDAIKSLAESEFKQGKVICSRDFMNVKIV